MGVARERGESAALRREMARKLSEYIDSLSPGRLTAVLAAVFAGAHVFYYALGVRFDDTPLAWYWQYLDPQLLKDKLLESVFYMHSQPPLFNLFLGAVLKIAGYHSRNAFRGVYLGLGLILYLSLFWLQVKLGVSRVVAFAVSTLFLLSPSFVLYEHWLFYAFPVAALLTSSALLFYEVLARRRAWATAALFGCLFLLCGIRHIFHLACYAAVAAAVAACCAGARRKVLVFATAPFLLLFSFYLKNYVLFGEFAVTSWTGMNLWQMTGLNLTLEEKESFLAEGKQSEASLAKPFATLADYPAAYADASRFAGVDALTRPYKSTGPDNYNHLAYVAISRAYLADSLYVVRRFPRSYLKGLLRSWYIYFKSSSDYVSGVRFLDEAGNLGRVRLVNELFDRALYGKVTFQPATRLISDLFLMEKEEPVYVYLWICLPLLLYYGFRAASRKETFGEGAVGRNRRRTVLYVCGCVLYVALVANGFSWAETNRMRFATDPLYAVLLGLFIEYAVLRGTARPQARAAGAN
jgi:hypothetical protein